VNLFSSNVTLYEQLKIQGQLVETTLSDEIVTGWLSHYQEVCLAQERHQN